VNLKQFVRLCGIVVTLFSVSVAYGFILSDAWFGVGLMVFLGMVGVKVIVEPELVTREKIPDDQDRRP
jgi:hypothetical protein